MKTLLNYFIFLLVFVGYVSCTCDCNNSLFVEPYVSKFESVTEFTLQVEVNKPISYIIDFHSGNEYYIYKNPEYAINFGISCAKSYPEQFRFEYFPKKDFIGIDYAEIVVEVPYLTLDTSDRPAKHLKRIWLDVKEEIIEEEVIDIKVEVYESKVYEFIFGISDFHNLFIEQMPSHASHCEIFKRADYPYTVCLSYVPEYGYEGADYVEVFDYGIGCLEEFPSKPLHTYRFHIENR